MTDITAEALAHEAQTLLRHFNDVCRELHRREWSTEVAVTYSGTCQTSYDLKVFKKTEVVL